VRISTVQPCTKIVTYGKSVPEFAGNFIAPTAAVIGKVKIGKDSSVWYGAVVRGDVNSITIGEGVTIGDRAMIHCSGLAGDYPTVIGNNVLVGAGAIVHGATLEDDCLIGEGAQVMDNTTVQKHAIVAPGSIVPMGKVVATGQVWGGIPAAYIRGKLYHVYCSVYISCSIVCFPACCCAFYFSSSLF